MFSPNKKATEDDVLPIKDLSDNLLDEKAGKYAAQLREDIHLIDGVYDPFKPGKIPGWKYRTCVFFGSAINNFGGKRSCLIHLLKLHLSGRRPTDQRTVHPNEKTIQRLRILRSMPTSIQSTVTGLLSFVYVPEKFERGKFFHHVRLNKDLRFNSPAQFMAQAKSIIDEAYPGGRLLDCMIPEISKSETH
jgi:peptide chain release factor 3